MLKSIKISNFHSFDREVCVPLSFTETKRPISLIFGHNNSGKTNLLKAISFVKWLILFSFISQEPDEAFPYYPYLFIDPQKDDKPSMLEVTFSTKEQTYKYRVELNTAMILHEQLWIQNKNERVTFSTLFKRKWSKNKKKYSYTFNDFSMTENLTEKIIRKNCTLLSVAKQIENPDAKNVLDFWENTWTNVTSTGKIRNDDFEDISFVSKVYYDNDKLFGKVKHLFCDFDLGTNDLQIKKFEQEQNGKSKIIYRPFVSHKRKDEDTSHSLPIYFESSGTKNLFVLLMYLTLTLESGGVAIMDEIDGDLHPLLISKILDIFSNKRINNKNAQLILSTHNPDLMNILDKEQIILVEKNENLESDAYLLSDVEGVRNTENFAAKYLAGAYGAVMKE